MQGTRDDLVLLSIDEPFWDRFYTVATLVVVGTREEDGSYDFAPKHMAMALGRRNYFGFVCTPRHRTFHNAQREQVFTVSYPKPDQVVLASLAAAPRCSDDVKHSLVALPTVPANVVDGDLLRDAYLHLECELDRVFDGFGDDCLMIGRIVHAQLDRRYLRDSERDDRDLLLESPLLAYLSPGRLAAIGDSYSFPFAKGFRR